MNLHAIVSGNIAAINPPIKGMVSVSTGYTTSPDGTRVPTYRNYYDVSLQVQSLTFRDIMQINGLNLNGTRRAIYLYGTVDGLVRSENKGGDLITIEYGVHKGVWIVATVLEQWGDGNVPAWVKVAATLQDGA